MEHYILTTYCFSSHIRSHLYIFEGENTHCCQSLPLSCRQHCVKEVKIEHHRECPRRERIDTQNYSSDDGDILEQSIDDLWISLHETDDDDKSEGGDESTGSKESDAMN